MAKDNKDTSLSSLKNKFVSKFISGETEPSKTHTDKSVSLGMVNEVNDFELMALTKNHYVQDPKRPTTSEEIQIKEATAITHREVVNNIADAERIKALDPNIGRIEKIIVSSIMSPNDLQNVDPEITININGINNDKKERITKLLTDFYCDIYKIRERMVRWVKEAHFRSGAGVTMLLPEATLTKIIDKYDPERNMLKAMVGKENLLEKSTLTIEEHSTIEESVLTPSLMKKAMEYDWITNNKKSFLSGIESRGIRNNNVKQYKTDNDPKPVNDKKDVQYIVDTVYSEYTEDLSYPYSDKEQKELRTSIESIALKFKKTLHEEDSEQSYVNVVNNPDVCKIGNLLKKKQHHKYHDILEDSILKDLLKETTDNSIALYHRDIPIMDLTSEMTEYDVQKAFPFWIDVPTESVIPVCIPSSKKDKIGYFILIDDLGQPIEASSYIISNNGDPVSGRLSLAYNAMYGEQPTESGIGIQSGNTSSVSNMTKNFCNNKDGMSKVFNYVLDELLKKKLSAMGLTDITLGTYNSIATCMLYRLLDKKQTNLVFVPEKYITYMAFDYHFDGTGKSKIEDILYMESLKVCFNTANSLAIMKAAVPVKKVKLNLTQDQSATMQVLYMIRDAIVQREKFVPSTYPSTITSQMIAQNLSIEASHQNAEAFSYTVEDTHREIPKADTEYLKELDNNTIIGLGLFPSALNESSEVQFARSLATTNLYYSQSIREDQEVVEEFATKHIRNHLTMSSVLIKKIAEILDEDQVDQKSKDVTENKPTVADGSTAVSKASKAINKEIWLDVLKIIDSVEVKLAPPDMIPNEAQYAMLTEVIKRIDEYVNSVYPDDMGTYGDDDLSQPLRIFKAYVKSQMINDVANKIGFKGLLSNVPAMDDFLIKYRDKMVDTYGNLNGIKEGIKRETDAHKKKQDQHDDNDSGSSSNSIW